MFQVGMTVRYRTGKVEYEVRKLHHVVGRAFLCSKKSSRFVDFKDWEKFVVVKLGVAPHPNKMKPAEIDIVVAAEDEGAPIAAKPVLSPGWEDWVYDHCRKNDLEQAKMCLKRCEKVFGQHPGLISSLFIFSETPQGFDFWHNARLGLQGQAKHDLKFYYVTLSTYVKGREKMDGKWNKWIDEQLEGKGPEYCNLLMEEFVQVFKDGTGLDAMFTWEDTPQGNDFWKAQHEKLDEDGIRLLVKFYTKVCELCPIESLADEEWFTYCMKPKMKNFNTYYEGFQDGYWKAVTHMFTWSGTPQKDEFWSPIYHGKEVHRAVPLLVAYKRVRDGKLTVQDLPKVFGVSEIVSIDNAEVGMEVCHKDNIKNKFKVLAVVNEKNFKGLVVMSHTGNKYLWDLKAGQRSILTFVKDK